ncbi:hypothetical protein [Lelliottia wanjuensis]|uniref:Uncharacterized protein n=1 Tax=Lelliottia wanjuensis TaxID=3050585 RepID=A0AAP4D4E4_9ENTR|nr:MULTISPECIES: hypothetical protein [unclassified Lelliottia]MDK9364169.1 hypothetical protein [Lelliottia sp. V106_12]MDK9617154.1 hypothetical protein [Lelliottia sp. V106_9]
MNKDSDAESYILIFILIIVISAYYCYRWYENSQNTQGFLVERCWLAREVRSSNDDLFLDGEHFYSRKTIQHGQGSYSGYYGKNNATETVYVGSNGNLISLYDYQRSDKSEVEKLGIKFFGIKFYLPCTLTENENSW